MQAMKPLLKNVSNKEHRPSFSYILNIMCQVPRGGGEGVNKEMSLWFHNSYECSWKANTPPSNLFIERDRKSAHWYSITLQAVNLVLSTLVYIIF